MKSLSKSNTTLNAFGPIVQSSYEEKLIIRPKYVFLWKQHSQKIIYLKNRVQFSSYVVYVCSTHLNYYLSGAVCPSVCLSVFLQKFFFSSKIDQIRWTDISNSRIQARSAWRLVRIIKAICFPYNYYKSIITYISKPWNTNRVYL